MNILKYKFHRKNNNSKTPCFFLQSKLSFPLIQADEIHIHVKYFICPVSEPLLLTKLPPKFHICLVSTSWPVICCEYTMGQTGFFGKGVGQEQGTDWTEAQGQSLNRLPTLAGGTRTSTSCVFWIYNAQKRAAGMASSQ